MLPLMSQAARKATAADLLATHGEDARVEIIHGEMLPKAMPRLEHSHGVAQIMTALGRRFDRKPGGKWPGGWQFMIELHVGYETHELFCHDLCGYRRDLHPAIARGWPCLERPDWVLEALSPSQEKRDLLDKWRVLHTARVPHYWILHPEEKVLQVLRWSEAGYLCVTSAGPNETIRAEPFDAVELRTNVLFGDEDDEE